VNWRVFVSGLAVTYLVGTRAAFAQLRVPPIDSRGAPLVAQATVEQALQQQHTTIVILLLIVALSIGATIWVSMIALRLQFTVERIAEAVRRVDLLESAFRTATTALHQNVEAVSSKALIEDWTDEVEVVDLDDDITPRFLARRVS